MALLHCWLEVRTYSKEAIFYVNTAPRLKTPVYIKTHDSESRGQEEAQQCRPLSELFTRSTALKLANALAKPPLKLSLSYY